MSLSILKAGLEARIGRNLMPRSWLTETLMTWCRELARHNDGVLDQEADDELFDLMNSVIEKLLADDADRLKHYRDNRASMFYALADELDEIVRRELVSRTIEYDIDYKTRGGLFHDHFPESLEVVKTATEIARPPTGTLSIKPLNDATSENA